jgi:carboxyl-terminal processing protease
MLRQTITPEFCMRPYRATAAALGLFTVLATDAAAQGAPASGRTLAEVIERITMNYVDSVPRDSAFIKAARGLVSQIGDPYAQLFSPAELASFTRNTIGDRYGGLGMSVESHDSGTYIVRVFEGSPGAKLGIRPGDRIDAVDGTAVRGFTLDQVTRRTTGPVGTKVTLTLYSPRTGTSRTVETQRALVHAPAVPFPMMLEQGIGYLPLQRFSGTSATELRQSIARLKASGATRFILDLRGNGGGELDAAEDVSQVFLKRGQSIVSIRHRGQPEDLRVAGLDGESLTEPLVVLVDGGTASASEIVSGALQDHDRAVVIGTTTFGKGLVQGVYRLSSGWALKLTTGKWYTPSGRLIQREYRMNESGQFVEELPDSIETDSVRRSRPVFRSAGGRPVYGGGGITPDLIVSPDTLSTAEQRLLGALNQTGTRVSNGIFAIALRHLETTKPSFIVPETWGDTLYREFNRRGITVDKTTFDAGNSLVTRLLDRRLASLAHGDSTVVRHALPYDPQLRRAVDLLRASPTTAALFARTARPTG